jgi:hypothetical protein
MNGEEIIFLNSYPIKKNIKTNMITEIEDGKNKWKINENNNKLYINEKFNAIDKNFYQSLITNNIVTRLLLQNKTELPTFSDLYFIQKKLINIFKKKFLFYKKIT